jgi:RNase P subunit RPR2
MSEPAICSECDSFLGNPKNLTHILTEDDTMVFAMNCGSCNAMNEVHTQVAEVRRI